MQKSSSYEKTINELNGMLKQKEKELENQKKTFEENEKNKKNYATSLQKNEWGKMYGELLEEIKQLKVEIDLLGFENKKLLDSAGAERSLESSFQNSEVVYSKCRRVVREKNE